MWLLKRKKPIVGNYHFFIVGHYDNPLFKMEFKNEKKRDPVPPQEYEEIDYCLQMFAHSCMDYIEAYRWRLQRMYLKQFDKFNRWFASAFITACGIRFIIIHDEEDVEGMKDFFEEVYNIYIKYSTNPFYDHDTEITCSTFRDKVYAFGRKYFTA